MDWQDITLFYWKSSIISDVLWHIMVYFETFSWKIYFHLILFIVWVLYWNCMCNCDHYFHNQMFCYFKEVSMFLVIQWSLSLYSESLGLKWYQSSSVRGKASWCTYFKGNIWDLFQEKWSQILINSIGKKWEFRGQTVFVVRSKLWKSLSFPHTANRRDQMKILF